MADRIGVMDRGRLPGSRRAALAVSAARHAVRRDVLGRRESAARALRLSRRAARRVVLRGGPLVGRVAQRRRGGRRRAARGRRARADARSLDRARGRHGQDRRAQVRRLERADPTRDERDGHARERAAPRRAAFTIEAVRTASDVEAMPLAIGQKVYVGFKHMHALPTPISSLRLVASGGRPRTTSRARRSCSSSPSACTSSRCITTTSRSCPSSARAADLGRRRRANVATALELLERGARQVLVLASQEPRDRANADLRRAVLLRARQRARRGRELGAPFADRRRACWCATRRTTAIAICSTCATSRCGARARHSHGDVPRQSDGRRPRAARDVGRADVARDRLERARALQRSHRRFAEAAARAAARGRAVRQRPRPVANTDAVRTLRLSLFEHEEADGHRDANLVAGGSRAAVRLRLRAAGGGRTASCRS